MNRTGYRNRMKDSRKKQLSKKKDKQIEETKKRERKNAK